MCSILQVNTSKCRTRWLLWLNARLGDKNMIRIICKKVDNDELPYHVKMIVNDNKEYYGLGRTIGGAINRIESLSRININHHVHEFDNMDICKHCKISKESLSNVYRLVESNIVQKV